MHYYEILSETWVEHQVPKMISKTNTIMSKDITANFTTDYGQIFQVRFSTGYYPQEQDRWEVHFNPISDAPQQKTANALSVFRSLAVMVQQFLDEKQPKILTFGGEPKRFKILLHLIKDRTLSNYVMNVSNNRVILTRQ